MALYATFGFDSGAVTIGNKVEAGVSPLLKSISEITYGTNFDCDFEYSGATLIVSNGKGEWDAIVAGSDKDLKGIAVTLKAGSSLAAATTIGTMKLRDLATGENRTVVVQLDFDTTAFDRYVGQSFASAGGPPMDPSEFAELVSGAGRKANIGQWFGPCIGRLDDLKTDGGVGGGNLPCWRYSHIVATGERFIIGVMGATSKTKRAVYNPAGSDVSSSATLSTHKPLNITYDCIVYNGGNLQMNCNLSSDGDPTTVFSADYGLGDIASLVSFDVSASVLQGMGYKNDYIAVACTERVTGREFLRSMALSFALMICPRLTGGVLLRQYKLEPTSRITADKTLAAIMVQPESFKQIMDYDVVRDRQDYSFWFHHATQQYQQSGSVSEVSGWTPSSFPPEEYKFIRSPQLARKVARRRLATRNAPHCVTTFSIPLMNRGQVIGLWADPIGSVISLTYPDGLFANQARLLQVLRMTIRPDDNLVDLETIDLTMRNADVQDVRLLVRGTSCLMDSSDNTVVFDNSPKGQHALTCTAITISTTDGSLGFNGTTSLISAPTSSDFDLLAASNANWTARFRVKHTNSTAAVNEPYCARYVDADNYWTLRRNATSNTLRFVYRVSAVTVNLDSSSTLADTNWHDVVLVKVGNNLGVYLDGTQIIYRDLTGVNYSASAPLYLGFNGQALYFPGSMMLAKVTNDNCYGAAPNSGKTDTITVPTWDLDDQK